MWLIMKPDHVPLSRQSHQILPQFLILVVQCATRLSKPPSLPVVFMLSPYVLSSAQRLQKSQIADALLAPWIVTSKKHLYGYNTPLRWPLGDGDTGRIRFKSLYDFSAQALPEHSPASFAACHRDSV